MNTIPQDEAAPAAPQATPEERQRQFQDFMGKVLGDVSRLTNQVAFISRQSQETNAQIHERLDYLQGLVGMIFEALHLEMPQQQPKLIDARVELVETLDEDEVCEFRVAYSSKPHPVFGHLQFLIGSGDQIATPPANGFPPILIQRLSEAFAALETAGTLKDQEFYYARVATIHARPINESSVPLNAVATADIPPAANDDAAPLEAVADVQPE